MWCAVLGAPLEDGFETPPDSTKPSCYWYWISDHISKEGITADLEAMRRVGIGEAFIGNIYLEDTKIGSVKALTEEWWGMVEHAVREGTRLGVKVGMFNCPGWSQSGGPWIQPGDAMRRVSIVEHRITGPARFSGRLESTNEHFQQIASIAFPAPPGSAVAPRPRLTTSVPLENPGALVDGNPQTAAALPGKNLHLDLDFDSPLTARSLLLTPDRKDFSLDCELLAEQDGRFVKIREFPLDRSNNSIAVGFVQYAPLTISFPPVSASRFRLVFKNAQRAAGIAEIELSGEPRIERYIEKQLGKMHPTPLPMWGDYLWPSTAEPGQPGLVVAPDAVRDLSKVMSPDGTIVWNVPPGQWVILRVGMIPTGTKNAPASPQGQGLEVDKMNRAAAKKHFDAYIGELLRRVPAPERKSFERVIADSYEMGAQNWTDGLREIFRKRYGYDPQPWLPVLTGRIVGSAEMSDRFLWDLRRLVADQVAYDYVGGLRDACHKHGLKLWLENYGHWGFPAEFLQYGGQSDEVSGEFWSSGNLGSIELRAASSAAHIYGKPRVSAEAFTSTAKFDSTPWSLKRRGDWALTEGINHWVLHVYIHQPWEDKLPGVNAWFSTEFNRHNPWFFPGREFIDYYRRCQFLLQQGRHVADVAYFIGEDTPKMTGIQAPALPAGYNFDYINAEVITSRLKIRNGRFTLPDGMSYRVMVLPPGEAMRPGLLEKIRDLVRAGGIVLGNPPTHSPSLQGYPKADAKVKDIAAELWKGCDGRQSKMARFGKGRVFQNMELQDVFNELSIPPQFACGTKDILWTQREDENTRIFFVCNQSDRAVQVTPAFRSGGKTPELWDPAAKTIHRPAVFSVSNEITRVPFDLEPRGSRFVIFRQDTVHQSLVKSVSRDGQVVASANNTPAAAGASKVPNTPGTFTMAAWVLPSTEIALPQEANSGAFLGNKRNDLVAAPHGQSSFGRPADAGAGLSVGKNGIVVYEHSANYFAPVLAHPDTLNDWTHIAVVYDAGRPTLYVSGRKAREGLQSNYTVHSGIESQQGPAEGFAGKAALVQGLSKALNPAEIAALAREAPPSAQLPLPPIVLTHSVSEGIMAEVFQAGSYSVTLADGQELPVRMHAAPEVLELDGSWDVHFPAQRDVPARIRLEQLIPLSEHSNPAIQHFSGIATYQKTFEATPAPADSRVLLDLGDLEGVAEVELNGTPLGALWKTPYIIDVTKAFKPGNNELVIRVAGTWRNRLVGDARFPEGFPGADGRAKALEFKPFLTADLKLKATDSLSRSGLIGPVKLYQSRRVRVK